MYDIHKIINRVLEMARYTASNYSASIWEDEDLKEIEKVRGYIETLEADNLSYKNCLLMVLDLLEKNHRSDQHNSYSLRELHPELFILIDSLLKDSACRN